jgi:CHAT domain-containing protein/tetratricopeptide (TPR) repeat protein
MAVARFAFLVLWIVAFPSAAAGASIDLVDDPDVPPVDRCDSLRVASNLDANWNGLQEVWMAPGPDVRRRLAENRADVREALDCYGDRAPEPVGEAYFDLAYASAALRDFETAYAAFDTYFQRFGASAAGAGDEAAPAQSWAVRMHHARAYLNYLQGNFSGSIRDYSQAALATPDSLPRQKAELSRSLAIVHQRIQDFDGADFYLDRASKLLRGLDAPASEDREALARVLYDRADLLVERATRPGELRASMRTSLQEADRLLRLSEEVASTGGTVLEALRLSLRSEIGIYLGAADSSLVQNARALEIAREADLPYYRGIFRLKRGRVHLHRESWPEAKQAFETALRLAGSIERDNLRRRALYHLGLAHELEGDAPVAASYYRRAIQVAERHRSSLRTTQWSSRAFDSWQRSHRGLVRVLLAQDRSRAALQALEQTRARHLTDLRIKARVTERLSPNQRVRFDSLTVALTEIRNRMAAASISPDSAFVLRGRESRLSAERRRLLRFSNSSPAYSVAALQDTLRHRGQSLVSYFLDAPAPPFGRRPQSAAFVVTPDTVRSVRLPAVTQDSVRRVLARVSPLFREGRTKVRLEDTRFDLSALHALHETVMAPLRSALPPDQPLVVVPDGPLFRVSFAMLVTEPPAGPYDYADAPFLVRERATSMEIASSLVADTTASPRAAPAETEVAAFGRSKFDSVDVASPMFRSMLSSANPESTAVSLPSLPGVRTELRNVQSRFERSVVALDSEATEGAFHRRSGTSRILHLASHSFVHPSSPLYNAILLSGSDDGGSGSARQDGMLFLHELQRSSARIPLVVLSGCSTARGILRSGEGMEGLQYAFRAMGAASTLSNLWPAADRAAVELTDAFYRHLAEGDSKARALQRAQLEYLQSHPNRASPFFWAQSVLYGQPAPVSVTPNRLSIGPLTIAGALAVLLLAAFLARFWHRLPGRARAPA